MQRTQNLSPRALVFYFSLIVALIFTAYSNHFNNAFHFDDSHVIESNLFIQSLDNIPLFFKDATTISSLPTNQQYRPMVTTSLAIDYWLGHELKPFWFHVSTFCWYILQCLLMYFFFLKIANTAVSSKWNPYFSLFAMTWYGVHAANAETINYVSARSDSLSTCWLMLSFIVFIGLPAYRKWGLHLVPIVIAALFKQTVIVFPALLSLYVLYFEEQASLTVLFEKKSWPIIKNLFKKNLSSWIVCAIMFVLVTHMDPVTFSPGGTSVYQYLITQPYVFVHYFITFFFPLQLSADTDLSLLPQIIDDRFFIGIGFVLSMLTVAFLASKKTATRPVSFGIFWFFIALLPTSSFIPLAEVANDHRIFFPFIGLLLAVAFGFYLIILKNKTFLNKHKLFKAIIATGLLFLLAAHAYGTYQRNKVWLTQESLWHDVTLKSPKNGRGLMNYGLTQMSKGNYPEAEIYLTKALTYTPYYPALHINLAILNNALGKLAEAETYYQNALRYGNQSPEALLWYARFNQIKNPERAEESLLLCLQKNPKDIEARHLLMQIYFTADKWSELNQQALTTIKIIPNDAIAQEYLTQSKTKKGKIALMLDDIAKDKTPEKYIQLSLLYFDRKEYEQSIKATQQAIKLKPDFAIAYNNQCASYNELKEYKKAAAACQHALTIDPSLTLARNNLNASLESLKKK